MNDGAGATAEGIGVTYADLLAARERIAGVARQTPVMTSAGMDERAGASLYFKCENFQRTGSFKIRGASNLIAQLTAEERARGVVTHSSGNHGQAVALAAKRMGARATVVMPRTAPAIKREAVAGYGAETVLVEPTMKAREAAATAVMDSTGAVLVHPYDDDRIIAGQGTCAIELLEEVPELDTILAPIGGGGMISGASIAAAHHGGPVRVIGAEPALADDAYKSLQSGVLDREPTGPTIADGLRANICERTFNIIRRGVESIVLVSEEEIVEAMQLVWRRMKIAIEPSSATAVAAVIFHRDRVPGRRIGVILTGGNVDFPKGG
jgi:threonine dehydratase